MFRRLLVTAGLLFVLVGGWFVWLLWVAGEFRTLEARFEGTCVQVNGIVGAEDVTIHPRSGIAYISAHDRRAVDAGGAGHGAIYAYDLKVPVPRLRDLTPDAPADFRPHGISLYAGDDGPDLLFVVNHSGGRHTIEIYEAGGSKLVHRETLSDDLLVSPNDVVAIDDRRFYVSNDHGRPPGLMRTLEEYLRLPLSTIVYYDGAAFSTAASGLRFANGINRSADGGLVYVNPMLDNALNVYERDEVSGGLRLREKVALDSGGDNIEVDAEGALWVGAHPRLLTLARNARDPALPAPAQVLRVRWDADGNPVVEEIFVDLGARMSAASVAASRGNRLLIGTVWESRFLDCTLGSAAREES